jgi:hypothetical protein
MPPTASSPQSTACDSRHRWCWSSELPRSPAAFPCVVCDMLRCEFARVRVSSESEGPKWSPRPIRTQLRAFTTLLDGAKPTKQIPWFGLEIPAQGPDPYIRKTLARLYNFSRVPPSRALQHQRRRRIRFAASTSRLRPVARDGTPLLLFMLLPFAEVMYPEDLWCVDRWHTGLSFRCSLAASD